MQGPIQRRTAETVDASFPDIQSATFGRFPVAREDEEAAESTCRRRCSIQPRLEFHALAALYAATTCQCSKTALPPFIHSTEIQIALLYDYICLIYFSKRNLYLFQCQIFISKTHCEQLYKTHYIISKLKPSHQNDKQSGAKTFRLKS